ncbi:hypothetical protein [Streptomyces hainanensis]|uniref:Uncharacterized protein n=1 Tax=Streptomyces hainanensis TaxID=402648 RepID=A0A4V2Y1V6_9ACTN|nr:hypothetical protein [Streptomyces hainanensis]TDC70275.1 hypothetical protein E1283_24920 [Streptomyces hainanensis]
MMNPNRMISLRPDAVFGATRDFGIHARLAHSLDEQLLVLAKAGFVHEPATDVFLLPPSMRHGEAIRRTLHAVHRLRELDLEVVVDPQILRPMEPVPDMPRAAGALIALTDELDRVWEPRQLSSLIAQLTDERDGVLTLAGEFLSEAAQWCAQEGTERPSPHLDRFARDLELAGEDLGHQRNELSGIAEDLLAVRAKEPRRHRSGATAIRPPRPTPQTSPSTTTARRRTA